MALKREQFLVGQPKRAPKAPKSRIKTTLGTLTADGRRNVTKAPSGRRGKIPNTPLNAETLGRRMDGRTPE